MDYEKEYKKKLEDAKYWHDCSEGDIPAILEEIFSELKESNNEEIRKAISYAIANSTHEDGILINGVTESEAIAWLEKQGKYKFEHGDDNATKVFKNEDGTHSNISQLERVSQKVTETEETAKEFLKSAEIINENGELAEEYRLEKQGEPKFKVGDWVARGNVKAQIIGIEDNKYCFDGYNKVRCSTIDKHYHLWTIQDAKDGDVLEFDCGIGIFKNLSDDGYNAHCYCYYDRNGQVETNDYSLYDVYEATPATKEQRDLLFQKMKEAGFNWNAKKKILTRFIRTIKPTDENTSSTWSEDDEIFVHGLIRGLSAKRDIHGHTTFGSDYLDITETINWLRSLKDRFNLQPKQEWSEEDKANLLDVKCIIDEIWHCQYIRGELDHSCEELETLWHWLDDIWQRLEYPQSTWRPSDEQMAHLVAAIEESDGNCILQSLYNDLKKL